LRLHAEFGDNSARAAHNFGRFTIAVYFAQSTIFTELFSSVHHDEMDSTFLTKSFDKLGVLGVVAVRGQAAQLRLLLIERFSAPKHRQQQTITKLKLKETINEESYSCNPRLRPSATSAFFNTSRKASMTPISFTLCR
jgi:hypothetical protein